MMHYLDQLAITNPWLFTGLLIGMGLVATALLTLMAIRGDIWRDE